MKETLKEGGYRKAKSLGCGQFILTHNDGNKELWFANKDHASYGLIYKNTLLEFCSSVKEV